jgi:hypothetical protein
MSEEKVTKVKKAYEAPMLIVHGSLEELTQGSTSKHSSTDASFGVGTPSGKLTFS